MPLRKRPASRDSLSLSSIIEYRLGWTRLGSALARVPLGGRGLCGWLLGASRGLRLGFCRVGRVRGHVRVSHVSWHALLSVGYCDVTLRGSRSPFPWRRDDGWLACGGRSIARCVLSFLGLFFAVCLLLLGALFRFRSI